MKKNCHPASILYAVTVCIALSLVSSSLWAEEPTSKDVVTEDGKTYYVVKSGDTLWSISMKFLNSPYYWPDLWKVNADTPITNPHRIFPGQKIRLFQKGELASISTTAPKELPPAPMAPPVAVEDAELPPDIPPLEPGEPLPLGDLKDDSAFDYASINRIGFIRQQPATSLGFIFKVKDDKTLVGDGDIVYIKESGEGELSIAKRYTLYRIFKPLSDNETNQPIGTQHLLSGTVEIMKRMKDFVIGKVATSYRPIHVGDMLIPQENRSGQITPIESVRGLMGKIVTNEEHSFIMGEHDIAFIDKGEENGVKPGQTYDIFIENTLQTSMAGSETVSSTVDTSIGSLIVLLVEPTTATVMITRSQRTIQAGTKFRSLIQ